MTSYQNIKVPEGQIIVPMDYNQLKALMEECASLAIKNYCKEVKNTSEQKWVSATEAAKIFGCSVSTINRWKHSGYLTARTLGGKDLFSMDEITNIKTRVA